MNLHAILLLALLGLPLPELRAATEGNAPAAVSREQTTLERARQVEARQAQEWGLRPEEWTRYRELMRGPLGVYSPNLDPLTALGIEARDDEERARYAELQVHAEARRVERLLAYQRAYDAAWQRLFPGLPRVDLSGLDSSASADAGRLAVFVKDDCILCDTRVRALQASGAAFDLYMIESRNDDGHIRRWAARAGIDPAKVRARTITLNHDAGRWRSLGLPGELPAVLRRKDGRWQRQ